MNWHMRIQFRQLRLGKNSGENQRFYSMNLIFDKLNMTQKQILKKIFKKDINKYT